MLCQGALHILSYTSRRRLRQDSRILPNVREQRGKGSLERRAFKATIPNEYLSRLPAHNPVSLIRVSPWPTSRSVPSGRTVALFQADMDTLPNTRTSRPESAFFSLKHEYCEPLAQTFFRECLSSGLTGHLFSASCAAGSKRSDRPSRSGLVILSSCTTVSAG